MQNNIDFGSYLLLCCLKQEPVTNCTKSEIKDYVSNNSLECEAAFRVAEWLGLVISDETSEIGWKPTELFGKIMLRRQACGKVDDRKTRIELWEEEAFETTFEAATGERYKVLNNEECESYTKWFLQYLLFMVVTIDGEVVPTRRLLNLAAEARRKHKLRNETR